MSAAVINITAFICIAVMLTAVMLIAWRSFGRPQHALVWAMAFGVAVAGLCGILAMRLYAPSGPFYFALIAGVNSLFSALIAIGFIRRSRPQLRIAPLLLAAVGATLVVAALTLLARHHGIRDGIWLWFGGMMLLISASKVGTSLRRVSLPERTTTLILVLCALMDFITGAIAFSHGAADPDGELWLYLAVLHPLSFIAIGLFAVFLVAADLAENMMMLATSDILTGVYNRRGFEEAAERAIRNAQRQGQPLAVVVADIDNFKAVNDRHGHIAGDRALCHFATRLGRLIRRGDLIGRIGGEEFALLLVNTRAADAVEVVERIRRDIAAMPVQGAVRIAMTASFGVTGLQPGDISLAALLARADRALYRSKLDGRDRVTSSEDLQEAV